MIDTTLLIVHGGNDLIKKKLHRLLRCALSRVRRKLYVHLVEMTEMEKIVPLVYHAASNCVINSDVDLRVLLNRKRSININCVFSDKIDDPEAPTFPLMDIGPIGMSNYHFETQSQSNAKYDNVVLGGTFDRLHNGHKILLSTALLLAKNSILCGINDGEMIKGLILIKSSFDYIRQQPLNFLRYFIF